jgi:hypothetical protein
VSMRLFWTIWYTAAFVLLGFAVMTAHAQKPEPSCNIQILVEANKDVDVTVPCVAREDVISVLSTFFAKGDEQAKKRIDKVLTDGGEVTLRITSKR